jgi:small subunit ribosomal protein S6
MAFYEVVFIIRPDVSTQQAEAVAGKLADVAVAKGGKVIKSEQWGLRTLAYRIKKHRKGYYVLLGLSGSGDMVAEIERQVTISDDIIRHLVVRVDEMTKEPSVQMQFKARAERTGRPMAGRVDEGFDVENA